MNSSITSPGLNPMARQNIYISPRINPLNRKYYIDSSDEPITSSDTNSLSSFSSNDSMSSFEDYRIKIESDKKEEKNITLSSCNRGFISSVCCSWCTRS
jgi:hypothetical protein